jgi:RNA polymerase II transcription factor SIII (Elongin) subunit A
MKSLSRISNPERVGAPRLVDLALATARRNAQFIDDVGNLLPIRMVMPILKAVERPAQLAILEKNRPELVAETHELWFNMIKRDVPGWEKMLLTKVKRNGETWTVDEIKRKATATTYRNCMEKNEKEVAQATEVLRQAIAQDTKERRDKETRIVEKVPSSWEKRRHAPSTATRPKSDVISKMRREAAAHRQMQPGGSLSTPSHLLGFMRRPRAAIRVPRMRRLLDPASAPASEPNKTKPLTAPGSHTRARSDATSAKEPDGGASTAKETPAPSGSKPLDNREGRTTPKRKQAPTVLLPSKRRK